MTSRLSAWLNRKARERNLIEIKDAFTELSADEKFGQEFKGMQFRERWTLARDLVNLQRGKYQEWRMWGLVIAGIATAGWKIISWRLSIHH